MPDPMLLFLGVIILVALIFDFTNGVHDSANAIATVVSTKVLSPKVAVALAAALNLGGAFIGTKVAKTIGSGIVNTDMVMGHQSLVLTALIGAICWNVLTWYWGLPSSSSHALIGGLIGSAVMYGGWESLNYLSIFEKIILPLILSPLAGFAAGYAIMLGLSWIFFHSRPHTVNVAFKKLQIVSSAFMATSHGMNDAQKTMGIITLALFIFHVIPEIVVPDWVKIGCAMAMAMGTAMGGWKIVRTMGHKIFKLEPIHGFAAETAASLVITGASLLGAPVSTTHTISSSVIGVGASKRLSAVRWGVAESMVIAWVLTIPAAALVAAACYLVLDLFGLAI